MLTIKPHHFIDIIKLYGAGVEEFVPDEGYGHSFYKAANEIIRNRTVQLRFTLGGDDICANCKYNAADNRCTDDLSSIPGYDSKDLYNRMLDKRLIDELQIDLDKQYSAIEYCKMVCGNKGVIERVWQLEDAGLTQRRNDLFLCGCRKYLRFDDDNRAL